MPGAAFSFPSRPIHPPELASKNYFRLLLSVLIEAAQHDFGDLEHPANFRNGVLRIIIKRLGNCQLFAG
jgi:hypothetical protein